MQFELNKIYEIIYYDHFSTEGENSEEAIKHKDVILLACGRCMGYNDNYVVLSWNFESLGSDNNDNIHIFKTAIKHVREL